MQQLGDARAQACNAPITGTLGEAVSDLIHRALTVPRPTREVNGVRVFDLPAESPRVTSKKVHELDAEQK